MLHSNSLLLLSAEGKDSRGSEGKLPPNLEWIITSPGYARGMPLVPNQQAHSIHSLE